MIMQIETVASARTTSYDRQTLAGFYDQYSPGIFRYAFRLLGDEVLAEDCVSETFSRFLQALRDGRSPDNVQAYLYRVAHNWITDTYRRGPRFEPLDVEMHADPQDGPAYAAAKNIEQERVRQAMWQLPAEQRMVVGLRFFEDRSHQEAAAIMGKTIEATRALQHRALEALRRMLVEHQE
jgi:RNA polymerase sigma-70 factor, ECF subfamily